MKPYLLKSIVVLCIATLPVVSMAQNVINYFSVAGDVQLPVQISSAIGKFTIYQNNTRVDGNISWLEAFDGLGRRIVDNYPDKTEIHTGQPLVRHYIFRSLYLDSYGSGGNSTLPYSQTDQVIQNNIEKVGGAIFGGMGKVWGGSGYDIQGYPNFQIQAGASYAWGENVRAKLMLGDSMGFACWGGVGKDWLFNGKNKDMLTWNVGIGCYFSNDWFDEGDSDVTIGFTYGNASSVKDKALMFDGDFSLFFGSSKRFGILGGVGLGIGRVNKWFSTFMEAEDPDDIINPKFAWDAHIGIAVKLWSKKYYLY